MLELKEEEGDDIDENDPLWQAVLAAKGGDRSAAKQCLEDPDSMMLIPEVQALLMADTGGGDDWEKGAEEVTVAVEEVSIKEDATTSGMPAHAPAQKAAAAAPPMPPTAEDEEAEVEEVVIEESDPREHLNLVFIGHVDARCNHSANYQ